MSWTAVCHGTKGRKRERVRTQLDIPQRLDRLAGGNGFILLTGVTDVVLDEVAIILRKQRIRVETEKEVDGDAREYAASTTF